MDTLFSFEISRKIPTLVLNSSFKFIKLFDNAYSLQRRSISFNICCANDSIFATCIRSINRTINVIVGYGILLLIDCCTKKEFYTAIR